MKPITRRQRLKRKRRWRKIMIIECLSHHSGNLFDEIDRIRKEADKVMGYQ